MKKSVLRLIKIYQSTKPIRSQITRILLGSDRTCRFYPTCSDYAEQAIEKHGVFRGSAMGFWRVLRCGPWSAGGVDPVK